MDGNKDGTRTKRKRLREVRKTDFYNTSDAATMCDASSSSPAAPSSSSSSSDSSSSSSPSPKNDLLEVLHRKSEQLTEQEADFVHRQLGYIPYNLVEVAASHVSSDDIKIPLALKLYPLNKKEHRKRPSSGKSNDDYFPFPTMMWLSCPVTYAKISRLELSGWITKFQSQLLESNDVSAKWRTQMENAHIKYRDERWSTLSEKDRVDVETATWASALRDVGIAGIKDFHTVKCLHTHYAHHVSRPDHGNLIGQWTADLLKELNDKEEKEKGEKGDGEGEEKREGEREENREREEEREREGDKTETAIASTLRS